MPKNIPTAFNNGSNYDYHFIIKELAAKLKKQFTCLGENTEKYITFPIENGSSWIDKNGEEIAKNISNILLFFDSARFVKTSLSNLVNTLSEGLYSIKGKLEHGNKKCETCWVKYKYCDCFLEYTNFKDDLIKYKCLCCNRSYPGTLDEKLKEPIFNINKFSNHDINKFYLLLQNGAYPYEYMADWEKFNEKSLPRKEDFYSHLSKEDITDPDYTHAKRVSNNFAI